MQIKELSELSWQDREAFLMLAMRSFENQKDTAADVLGEILFRNRKHDLEKFRRRVWLELRKVVNMKPGDSMEALVACDLLFVLKYSLSEVSKWIGVSESALRFVFLNSLKVALRTKDLNEFLQLVCRLISIY